ncbi:MAG: rRNA pseudouridine synthase [Treponema sp.]|nr:rRNA pseudouridine synthase [Treponema sp.]
MRSRDLNFPDNDKTFDTNTDSKMRLQVFLAHSGLASRRASEKIIASGRVTVNGRVVTEMGEKVSVNDDICLDGEKITLEQKKRYVLLNKPEGYVCSLSDEKGREVAADLLKERYSERLYNIGRLDMYSQGLIIFTNDGDFAATLSHPSAELEKEYIVEATSPLPRYLCDDFMHGVRVDGVFYKCKSAVEINPRKMKVILLEGKNREIRTVFASQNVRIRRLTRVRIGNVKMENLQSGKFRDLTIREVSGLLALCKNTGKTVY